MRDSTWTRTSSGFLDVIPPDQGTTSAMYQVQEYIEHVEFKLTEDLPVNKVFTLLTQAWSAEIRTPYAPNSEDM